MSSSRRHRARLGSLLVFLALSGCVGARPSELDWAVPAHPQSVELAGQGDVIAMLARPSAEVAQTSGADRYRVLFEGPGAIALVLLDDLDQPHARVRLRAIDHAQASTAWEVDFEDLDVGVAGRIEQWSLAGRLHGSATIGERSASWRARFEPGGRLAAERWRIELGDDPRVTAAIRRARAIGRDLALLASELDASLTSEGSCQIVEAIAHVELALDLALRAYEGRGRAEMPAWASAVADTCE